MILMLYGPVPSGIDLEMKICAEENMQVLFPLFPYLDLDHAAHAALSCMTLLFQISI